MKTVPTFLDGQTEMSFFTYDSPSKSYSDNVTVHVRHDYPSETFVDKTGVAKDSNSAIQCNQFYFRYSDKELIIESTASTANIVKNFLSDCCSYYLIQSGWI